ncbi:hypothetical protein VB005_04374 [Metarhizium brunneum]
MKFTPVVAAALVAFATAHPAPDAQGADLEIPRGKACAGFKINEECEEYAKQCWKELNKSATVQEVINCTQKKLKDAAAALDKVDGQPTKEQLCAGYLDHPDCKKFAQDCYTDSRGQWTGREVVNCTQQKLKDAVLDTVNSQPTKEQLCAGYLDHPDCKKFAQDCYTDSRGQWTGRRVVHCTQKKLVGPDEVAKICVPWDNEEGCLAKITDCNTKGKVLADCMSPDFHGIVDIPPQPAQP